MVEFFVQKVVSVLTRCACSNLLLLQNELEAKNNSLETERNNGKLKLEQRLEELRKELSREWSERLK